MNFEQALSEMVKGHYVRLSDWSGYWYMPYVPTVESEDGFPSFNESLGLVKVFTRDGDTLDTPYIGRYQSRDDWEVVTEVGFSFDMALRFMKNGKSVKRQSWHQNSYTLSLVNDKFLASGIDNVSKITFEEILANDWQIANA